MNADSTLTTLQRWNDDNQMVTNGACSGRVYGYWATFTERAVPFVFGDSQVRVWCLGHNHPHYFPLRDVRPLGLKPNTPEETP